MESVLYGRKHPLGGEAINADQVVNVNVFEIQSGSAGAMKGRLEEWVPPGVKLNLPSNKAGSPPSSPVVI